jgi:hypothetical protein
VPGSKKGAPAINFLGVRPNAVWEIAVSLKRKLVRVKITSVGEPLGALVCQ